jgi:hypothetical protein
MTWIAPIAIGGMILAAGPIIIHIIFRRRYRVVRFAAFQFLLENRKRTRQRIRIEELILILLRVLACCLLGFLLSDIRLSGSGGGAGKAMSHVFLLDDSLSMGQQAGSASLFKKALSHVVRRIESMGPGESVAVISASRPRDGRPIGRLVPAAEAKSGQSFVRLNAWKPCDLRVDIPGALDAAAAAIAAETERPARVYVCGDFRKSDFSGAEQLAAIRSAMDRFDPKKVEVVFLDFGLPCRNNLAVENLAAGRGIVVAGVSTPVHATIRNVGSEPTAETRLQASLGETSLPVQPVPALAPRETALIEFVCNFPAAGAASVRVSLPPDDLPADSVRSLALDVQESLRILVLDGGSNPSDPASASFALARALDPSGKAAFGRRVDVQSAENWNPGSLSAYDVAVMVNVRDFPDSRDADGKPVCAALDALDGFVREGGGLAIFAGDRLNADFYNTRMHADGKGISPLLVSAAPVAPPDEKRFVRLNPQSVKDEPMLSVFSSRGVNFSRFLRFYAHLPAEKPRDEAGAPVVLAEFDNGAPAVCRRSHGKGWVVMWYTSADTKWSNWPADLSFVPVVNDMAWTLARRTENAFADATGRAIGYTLPARLSAALSASLKTPLFPAEDIQSLALTSTAKDKAVLYPHPVDAGVYELTLLLADQSEHRVLFSRHTDPRESEPARVSESDLRVAIERPFAFVPDLATSSQEAEEGGRMQAWWWLFLVVLAAVLTLENFLALRFGHYQPRAENAPEAAR